MLRRSTTANIARHATRNTAEVLVRNAPPGRWLWIPVVSIMVASASVLLPYVATAPLLPPLGLMTLLAWRLLRPELFRLWAPVPLGFFDDLLSGQPLGSAMLLWTLCFLALDVLDRRMLWRDFRQDWLIGAGLTAAVIVLAALIAWRGPVVMPLAPFFVQMVAAAAAFPLVSRVVAWIDGWRVA